jgi:hypothetical protein
VIIVSPSQAPVGDEFTFTGSGFTTHGVIQEWLTDPNHAQHSLAYFEADSSGGFVRKHSWVGSWPAGTYTYLVFDFATLLWTSADFEMTEPLTTATPTPTTSATPPISSSYKVYLPVIVKNYIETK